MMSSMMNFVQGAVEFSLLGCVEVASVALIIYYIYAKTRAPAIIASLFPNLNLNINYRSPIERFNMGNELLASWRHGFAETKPQVTLAHGLGTQNMLELTPHAGQKPYKSLFDWGVYFPHIAQQLRSKFFQYPQVLGAVQKDPVLQRAIKQAAEQLLRERRAAKLLKASRGPTEPDSEESSGDPGTDYNVYQQILQSQERRARSILRDMRSTLNNFLLKLTSWILYKLLPCFLTGVVTHTKQIEMLKRASERSPGVPLIFLPLHRSHLDYIMVTFILLNNDIRCPLVAAGNNLQIPVFGGLLRGLGAFFIKRKIDPVVGKKDVLYRAALQLYLQHALKMGHNVEFFIEGGRTRTGKPCMPKGGILSVIVNAFMDRSIQDALLVPVSVNYERLVDGNFVLEQKGEKKVPESFGKAMSSIWKTLNSNYGLMRIDFNQPYSIRELVQSYNKIATEESLSNGTKLKIHNPSSRTLQHNQSTSSLYGTDVVCEEHRNLIDSISRQVVYDCAEATSVMSTNALAFLLLTRYRRGATDTEVARGLDQLRSDLSGRKDIGFSGNSMHIIEYACDLLGKDLVERSQNNQGQRMLRPKPSVESMIELSYYSNLLTPYYALRSIVLTTFHNMLPTSVPVAGAASANAAAPSLVRRKLIQTALENCDVYRYEFILKKPTQNLEALLGQTVDSLVMAGYIYTKESLEEENAFEKKYAQAISRHLDWDEGDEDGSENGMLGSDEDDEGGEPDLFLSADKAKADHRAVCDVLAPFGWSYLAVAQSLTILYQNPMLETEFIKFVISDISKKVQSGSCPYGESISTDSVRNCLKLLEKWSVIEICNQHGLRLLSLGALYETSKDSLKTITKRIAAVVPNYKNGYF